MLTKYENVRRKNNLDFLHFLKVIVYKEKKILFAFFLLKNSWKTVKNF